MNRRAALACAGAFAITCASGASGQAQTRWDMPTPYSDATFHTINVRWFADEVRRTTNSQLDITVHSNNSLIRLPEILRAVQTGQVPIGEILLSQFGNEDPIFEIEGIPFFAAGYPNARILYQVQRPFLEERLQRRGIRLLYSVAWPGQGLYSKQPLPSLAAYRGVRFRSYNPPTSRLAELLGAIPTTVQASDLPQAFATNIVQAMITSSVTGEQSKAWEFSSYYYDTRAMHPRNVVIVNERAFQRLPEAVRQTLLRVSTEAENRGWPMAEAAETESREALRRNGMNIVTPDAQMMTDFRAIGDRMIAEWIQRAGPDGQRLVDQYRERTR